MQTTDNTLSAEDADLEAAIARFKARRGQQQGDSDGVGKYVALGFGFALLLIMISSGSAKGASAAGQGGAGGYDPYAAQLEAQRQQQLNDAISKLARSGTRDCVGGLGCATQ